MLELINKIESEEKELSFKISNLEKFIKSDKIKRLDKESYELLRTQLFFMREYDETLKLRLKHIKYING